MGVGLCYLCVSVSELLCFPASHRISSSVIFTFWPHSWYFVTLFNDEVGGPLALSLLTLPPSGRLFLILPTLESSPILPHLCSAFSSEFSNSDCPSGRAGSCLKHFCDSVRRFFPTRYPHVSFSNFHSGLDPVAP